MAYRSKKILSFSYAPPLLLTPSIYSFLTLCRSDEYHPSKSEMQRNLSLSFPTLLFPSPYLSFLSPPVILCPHFFLSFFPISSPTFLSFLLHMWVSFSLIMMIWGSASVAGPLKPSSSSTPCLSFYCRQTARDSHKMASTLHKALKPEIQKWSVLSCVQL